MTVNPFNNQFSESPVSRLGDQKDIDLPRFVDFSQRADLKKYVHPEYQTGPAFEAAERVVGRTYCAPARPVTSSQYGVVFPMQPELLAYCMDFVRQRSKPVLVELGAASGENATLLAFSGAHLVYVNDISPGEIKMFEAHCKDLPKSVQDRLIAVEGSCLDLLSTHVELEGEVDLVLCRHLIHFLNDQDQEKLMSDLKQMLKPGGVVVFSANSKYIKAREDSAIAELFRRNVAETSFASYQCLLTNRTVSALPCDVLFYNMTLVSGDQMNCDYQTDYLYDRHPTKSDGNWVVDRETFQKIPEQFKEAIKAGVKRVEPQMKKITNGSVRMLRSVSRHYSEQNLVELFARHGFKCLHSFTTGGGRGSHILDPETAPIEGQFSCVIARYES